MPGHAQRQGFEALQDQPGGVRAHAGAEIAQALTAGPQQEGAHRAFLGKDHAVKTLVGFTQLGKQAVAGVGGRPVEAARVDQHAAHDGAVA